MIELDMATLTLLSGAVLPLLISVFVKANVASNVKVAANVILSMAAGGLAFLITNDGSAQWQELVNAMILAYLASNVSYLGTYKPTGLTESINDKTANLGIGTRRAPEAQPDPWEPPPDGPTPPDDIE